MNKSKIRNKVISWFAVLALTFVALIGALPLEAKSDSINISGMTVAEINSALDTALAQAIGGDVITLTGNQTNEKGQIALTIPAGVEVIWKATTQGLSISGQSCEGTFVVDAPGKIAVTGCDAITFDTGCVMVAGGEIIAERENSGDWGHRSAIRLGEGDVKVSGGKILTYRNSSAVYVDYGNVRVTGGEIAAVGETVGMIPTNNCYAIRVEYAGTVAVLGGTVAAYGAVTDNFAISIDWGLAAFLTGTCLNGEYEVWGNGGIVVEVDSLVIPKSIHDTTNGFSHVEGIALSNVKWDTAGGEPNLVFSNGARSYTVPWGVMNASRGVYPVRLSETGELFPTLSDGIAAAKGQGFAVFTLEVIGDVTETDSIVVGSENITIVGAEGKHNVSMASVSPPLVFTVEGGGKLTLGDGTNHNTLTILHSVKVTDGTISVRDGVCLKSGGEALTLSGNKAMGMISGGRFEADGSKNIRGTALSLENGASISEISGGEFFGNIDAVHLSGDGTIIQRISGGGFYQTDYETKLHGHAVFVQNGSQIGEISGGYFEASRNCALVVIRGGWVNEISGGEFVAKRVGTDFSGNGSNPRNSAIHVENGFESEGYTTTGIGTISGGYIKGTNFGLLLITDYGQCYVGKISGGTFEGTVALQNDRGGLISQISGGKIMGNQGILNVGRIELISGQASIIGKTSYAIFNYMNGQIDAISGGEIVSLTNQGIANSGVISLISGGTIIGETSAINGNGLNKGKLERITGGTFLGKNDAAIVLGNTLLLEPNLNSAKGLARYWGKDGVIFNDESLVVYPVNKGIAYQMSSVTEPVTGIADFSFKYLMLPASPSTYKVTYNGNGNTGGVVPVDAKVYLYNESVIVLGNTGNLVKTNHSFLGWSTNPQAPVAHYSAGYSFPISGNVTLYAVWQESEKYTVTYDGNGNTGGFIPQDNGEYYFGNFVTVKTNTGGLAKANDTFLGWSTNSDATVPMYAVNGDAVTPSTFIINSNVILYAVWQGEISPPMYVVAYEPGAHGTFTAQVTTGLRQGDATPIAPAVTGEAGWVFAGWTPVPTLIVTSNATYVAQWTAEILTVTFVDWDGSVLKIEQVPYGGSATAPTEPSRVGYRFIGWDKAFTNVTASIEVYALYEATALPSQFLTVIFVDWDETTLKTEQVPYGGSATAPDIPVREGYVFVGWDKTFSYVTADLVVTALYEVIAPAVGQLEWALLNLIMSVIGALIGVLVIIRANRKAKRKDRETRAGATQKERRPVNLSWLLLTIVAAIAGFVVFFITENMSYRMVWLDRWTIINAVILVAVLAFATLTFVHKKSARHNSSVSDN
ncbi:MAG: InlB B-repeat-containing protein [Dehalococcoidia bacterium]|nr:InlB B-repeat-containing protein [Dehalococcoidia bacterium]